MTWLNKIHAWKYVVPSITSQAKFSDKCLHFFNIQTWMYLSIPLLVYIGERLLRLFRAGFQGVKILKVTMLSNFLLSIYETYPCHKVFYNIGQLKKNSNAPHMMITKHCINVLMQVAVYPGNVLTLHMSKPQGFKYKSGQYIFLKCPNISPFEWYDLVALDIV